MGKRILIIDDENDFIKMLERRLRSTGYEVLIALDGLDGLEKARLEKPDLIILDIMLPKLDGNQVCKMLKSDKNYQAIPILILTARTQQKDKALTKEAGSDGYLEKPFEPDVLLAKIRELLGQ